MFLRESVRGVRPSVRASATRIRVMHCVGHACMAMVGHSVGSNRCLVFLGRSRLVYASLVTT